MVASRTEALAVINTGGGDNLAVAINTKDGTTLAETAFLITMAAADAAVDENNAAIAYSSCKACRTIAAAIQVVLVPSDTTGLIAPKNLAVAVNDNCVKCETLALAAQYVVGVSGPVEFTKEGNEQIKEIQKGLKELGKDADQLSLEEIKARFKELTTQLEGVLTTELVPAGTSKNKGGAPEQTTAREGSESTSEPSVPEGTSLETSAPATSPGETSTEMTTAQQTPAGETSTETTTVEKPLPQGTALEETAPATPEGQAPPKELVPGSAPGDATTPAQPAETPTQ
jgi:putative peptide zinc metalloprotease protein